MRFIVAYEAIVGDGPAAEREVHEELSRCGFRLNPSREFFEVPLKTAVAVVDKVAAAFVASEDDELGANDAPEDNGVALYLQAQDFMYGSGDELQDVATARALLERAHRLGCQHASRELASLMIFGMGGPRDGAGAAAVLRKAGEKGDNESFLQLWQLYAGLLWNVLVPEDRERVPKQFVHEANADVAFGWYSRALSEAHLPLPMDVVVEYLTWSRSLIAPEGPPLLTAARHAKELVKHWVSGCRNDLLKLREARMSGVALEHVLGDDGKVLSVKALLSLQEKFAHWGVSSAAALREILDAPLEAADLEFAFSRLPSSRVPAVMAPFDPYLQRIVLAPTSTSAPVAAPAADPAVKNTSVWSQSSRTEAAITTSWSNRLRGMFKS